jgi:hypothetical protein
MKKAPSRILRRPPRPVDTIEDDRRCIECGYSLRGLSASGVCPECGAEASFAVRPFDWGARVADDSELGLASSTYLVPLALALVSMALAAPALAAVGLATWNGGWSEFNLVLGLAAGAVWLCVTLVLCRDRPRPKGSPRHPDDVRAWPIRLLAVLSQPLWIVLPVLAQLEANGTPWASPAKRACFILAGLSACSAPVLAALTAEWAHDFHLMERLRNAAWFVAAAALGLGACHLITLTGLPPAMFAIGFSVILQVAWGLAMVAVALGALLLLLDVGWAAVNSTERLARDSRRAARERAKAAALAVPLPIIDPAPPADALARLEEAARTPAAPAPGDPAIGCQYEKHHIARPDDVKPYPVEESSDAPPGPPVR